MTNKRQVHVQRILYCIAFDHLLIGYRMPFSFRTFNPSFKRAHDCLHNINFTTSISELMTNSEYCHYIMESQAKSRWLTPQDDWCGREAEAVRSCTSDWEAQPHLTTRPLSLSWTDSLHTALLSRQLRQSRLRSETSWDAGIAAALDLTASKSAGHGNSGAKLYIHTM